MLVLEHLSLSHVVVSAIWNLRNTQEMKDSFLAGETFWTWVLDTDEQDSLHLKAWARRPVVFFGLHPKSDADICLEIDRQFDPRFR